MEGGRSLGRRIGLDAVKETHTVVPLLRPPIGCSTHLPPLCTTIRNHTIYLQVVVVVE